MTPHPPPTLEADFIGQLLVDAPPAAVLLIVPSVLMYLGLYAYARQWYWTSRVLAVPTLALFWMSADIAPVRCKALRAQLNLLVAGAVMKLIDIHVKSLTHSTPSYAAGKPPRPSVMALVLMFELRWESFIPNPIRNAPIPRQPFWSSPKRRRIFYSEPVQLLVHVLLFTVLQALPQYLPVKALGVLLSIWILWTVEQLTFRYRSSPPLFGPIYLADSLATFWTATWHNVFTAPCISLAYAPTVYVLSRFPVPRSFVRSCAVVNSFGLMAIFHMHALSPILSSEGTKRVGIFFVANGVLTVTEVAVWGKKKHWSRAIMAWMIELALASWTVDAAEIADGLLNVDWRGMCRAKIK